MCMAVFLAERSERVSSARCTCASRLLAHGSIPRRASMGTMRLLLSAITPSSAFAPRPPSAPLSTLFSSAGRRGQRHADRVRRRQLPLRLPRVRPPHRSRPRFLPQGGDGDDVLIVNGDFNDLEVCPASASPPLPTSFSSAGRGRRRLVHGQRLRQLRLWVRALSLPTDVDEAVHLEAVYSTPPPYVQALKKKKRNHMIRGILQVTHAPSAPRSRNDRTARSLCRFGGGGAIGGGCTP